MGYEPAWGLYFNTQAGRRIFRSTWNGLYGSLSGVSRGGTLRARAPTLFLDHAEARRAEEDFVDTVPAAPLSQGLDPPDLAIGRLVAAWRTAVSATSSVHIWHILTNDDGRGKDENLQLKARWIIPLSRGALMKKGAGMAVGILFQRKPI